MIIKPAKTYNRKLVIAYLENFIERWFAAVEITDELELLTEEYQLVCQFYGLPEDMSADELLAELA